MYVEEDCIIVDVKPSQESQVTEFLMTFCSHAFDKYGRSIKKTVKYVEQYTQPRFLGKSKRCYVRHLSQISLYVANGKSEPKHA